MTLDVLAMVVQACDNITYSLAKNLLNITLSSSITEHKLNISSAVIAALHITAVAAAAV